MTGSPALAALLLGDDDRRAQLDFYAEVMGLSPGPDGGIDLGPGGAEAEALARLILHYRGHLPAAVLRRRLMSLRVQAASAVRARGAARAGLRRGTGEVAVCATQPVHAGYFALDVVDLRHRRFDGAMSSLVRREVFVSGDAVTVLPYDPLRDRVLLVEQFRPGPLLRGDPLPWQLEAIAGRIDPGETPEAAARREAVEEAGLSLGALEWVAGHYPSPGTITEYTWSYVALCDLPDGVAGVFGAAEEGEDILGHLVPFTTLMAAIATGEVANAPLILTALWLQRERGRLRGEG